MCGSRGSLFKFSTGESFARFQHHLNTLLRSSTETPEQEYQLLRKTRVTEGSTRSKTSNNEKKSIRQTENTRLGVAQHRTEQKKRARKRNLFSLLYFSRSITFSFKSNSDLYEALVREHSGKYAHDKNYRVHRRAQEAVPAPTAPGPRPRCREKST